MECFLQYWDDLDDLVGTIGLLAEHLRRAAVGLMAFGLYAGLVGLVVYIALNDPPLAFAVLLNLVVVLVHRSIGARRPATA